MTFLQECAICYEDYSPDAPPSVISPCGHIMHDTCINSWFDMQRERLNVSIETCPYCREPLKESKYLKISTSAIVDAADEIGRLRADFIQTSEVLEKATSQVSQLKADLRRNESGTRAARDNAAAWKQQAKEMSESLQAANMELQASVLENREWKSKAESLQQELSQTSLKLSEAHCEVLLAQSQTELAALETRQATAVAEDLKRKAARAQEPFIISKSKQHMIRLEEMAANGWSDSEPTQLSDPGRSCEPQHGLSQDTQIASPGRFPSPRFHSLKPELRRLLNAMEHDESDLGEGIQHNLVGLTGSQAPPGCPCLVDYNVQSSLCHDAEPVLGPPSAERRGKRVLYEGDRIQSYEHGGMATTRKRERSSVPESIFSRGAKQRKTGQAFRAEENSMGRRSNDRRLGPEYAYLFALVPGTEGNPIDLTSLKKN